MTQQVRVCITDTTQGQLSIVWLAGSRLVGSFSERVRAANWETVYDHLWDIRRRQGRIDRIQFWGHGDPADPRINGASPDLQEFSDAARLDEDAEVWWRACNVFQGVVGQLYAARCTTILGCRVAGHTRVVSGYHDGSWGLGTLFYQSGLYGLRPGEAPHWPVGDAGGSGKRLPNTVGLFTRDVPIWAYQPR